MVHHPGHSCAPAAGSTPRDSPAADSAGRRPDLLALEAEAIHAIGTALSTLPDDRARARVLRWASERFGLDLCPVQGAGGQGAAAADATLAVGDLSEFFDAPPRRDPELSAELEALDALPPPAAAELPSVDEGTLDALDGDLAEPLTSTPSAASVATPTEVRAEASLAAESSVDDPCAAPAIVTGVDESVSRARPALDAVETAAPAESADFETAVHDFVAELQRLARDWETAFSAPKGL